MAILSKLVAFLAVALLVQGGTIPISERTFHKIHIRGDPGGGKTGPELAAGLIDTPMIFGAANPKTNSPEDSFLFDNDDYYNLQKYVQNGMKLASTAEIFEHTYNRKQFKAAVRDTQVYDLAQTTFVGINNHCTNFWDNTVSQMTLFAENIGIFGKDAAKTYRRMAEYLDTMFSIPEEERTTNKAWANSIYDIHESAILLQGNMRAAKEQSQHLLDNINNFRKETISDLGNLTQVKRNLAASDKSVARRIHEMNAEMRRLKEQFQEAEKDYEAARHKIKVGPAYCWIWPIGTAVYLGMSPKWRNERDKAAELRKIAMEKFIKTEAKKAAYIHVTDDIDILQMQTESVLKYINSAVSLLQDASDGFSNIQASISAIIANLDYESGATDPERMNGHWLSENTFRDSLESSADHWATISVAAKAFKGKSKIKIVSQEEAKRLYDQTHVEVYNAIQKKPDGTS